MITEWTRRDASQQAYRHMWAMRQAAIEAGLIAERVLIEAGELKPEDRRVITRKESRNGCESD
jgi:hypothetical protein